MKFIQYSIIAGTVELADYNISLSHSGHLRMR